MVIEQVSMEIAVGMHGHVPKSRFLGVNAPLRHRARLARNTNGAHRRLLGSGGTAGPEKLVLRTGSADLRAALAANLSGRSHFLVSSGMYSFTNGKGLWESTIVQHQSNRLNALRRTRLTKRMSENTFTPPPPPARHWSHSVTLTRKRHARRPGHSWRDAPKRLRQLGGPEPRWPPGPRQ
ncbi:unnamed protein product, partial [Iphiclides podalirius]